MNGRRARLMWARVGADDTLPQQRLLQALVVEVLLDELDHRPLEEQRDRGPVSAQAALDLVTRRRPPDPRVTRSFGAKGISNPLLEIGHGPPSGEVARGEPPDLLVGAIIVPPQLHAAAVVEGDEQTRSGRVPVQAMLEEAKLLDHERVQ